MDSRRARAKARRRARATADWEPPASPNTVEGRIDFVRRAVMAINARRRGEYESLPVPRLWVAVMKWSVGLLAAIVIAMVIIDLVR